MSKFVGIRKGFVIKRVNWITNFGWTHESKPSCIGHFSSVEDFKTFRNISTVGEKIICQISGESGISQTGWWGRQPIIFVNFPEKLHENEKFDWKGVVSLTPLLDTLMQKELCLSKSLRFPDVKFTFVTYLQASRGCTNFHFCTS